MRNSCFPAFFIFSFEADGALLYLNGAFFSAVLHEDLLPAGSDTDYFGLSQEGFLGSPATLYKRSSILCALLFFYILVLDGGTARAEGRNFLSFGLAGGSVIAPHAELESSPPSGDADFDGGYSIKASLGLLLAKKFQLEAEYLYTFNRIGSISNPPTVTELVNSDRVTHSLMLNATYRVEVPPQGDTFWVRRGYYVYFGGGVGVSWQDYTVETLASEADSSLAWQILIGFEKMNSSSYLFAALPSPFLQYRFLHITEGDFGAFKTDATLHLIEFGFRFYGGLGG